MNLWIMIMFTSDAPIDRMELVALGMNEIYECHRWVRLVCELVLINLRLAEEAMYRLIGGEQLVMRLPQDLIAQSFELLIREPLPAIVRKVDGTHCVMEHPGKDELAEA